MSQNYELLRNYVNSRLNIVKKKLIPLKNHYIVDKEMKNIYDYLEHHKSFLTTTEYSLIKRQIFSF